MNKLFESVYDLEAGIESLKKRRYGVIEVAAGKMVAVHFRPWPKLISATEAAWLGGWQHGQRKKDQCLAYYNQPLGHSKFLALKYGVTSFGTTYKTFRRTGLILDEIARIKGTDAIVAELTNDRISDRFMHRMGWEQHLLESRRRHFIKRFYGKYPEPIRKRLTEV